MTASLMADLIVLAIPSLCRYLDLTNPKLTLIAADIEKEQCHLVMKMSIMSSIWQVGM